MKKRILSMVLCLCMICSLLPVSAYAAEESLNLDIAGGSIIITGTGYKQGAATEETPYTGPYSITQTGAETANIITIESGRINLTISGLNIEPVADRTDAQAGSSITVKSGAVLNLTVSGENTLKASDCHAGICVEVGAEINIYGDGSSVLNAVGSGQTTKETYYRGRTKRTNKVYVFGGGAGIGGNAQHFKYTHKNGPADAAQTGVSFGTINIHSGTINATGGRCGMIAGGGAGIGSGGVHSNLENEDYYAMNFNSAISGMINIFGGTITARSSDETDGEDAAAIGTGGAYGGDFYIESKVAINISAGTVDAKSRGSNISAGAGIGNGAYVNGGTIKLSGGTITAVGGTGGKTDEEDYGGGAGIGCGWKGRQIDIEISGGTIVATAGIAAAGIGGSNSYQQYGVLDEPTEDVAITISSGTVTATGGAGAAGIGGGFASKNVSIEIKGGEINATGGNEDLDFLTNMYAGPGIGNGSMANYSQAALVASDETKTTILISGGTITATGGTGSEDTPSAAGIGGGAYESDVDSIMISGGSVTAKGGYLAAGIGGANASAVGTISITNGAAVYAYGGAYAKAIGVGFDSVDDTKLTLDDTITLWAATSGTQTSALPADTTLSRTSGAAVYLVSYTSGTNDENAATAAPFDADASALSLNWTFTPTTLTLMQNAADVMSIDTKQDSLSGNWATIWASPSYTVTFDLNYTDAAGTPTPQPQTIQHGLTAREPEEPVRTGYEFVGWFTSENNGATLSDTPYDFDDSVVNDITLYAKWVKQYTVTLNGNGLGYDMEVVARSGESANDAFNRQNESTDLDAGEALAPTREGYTFGGWYTDKDTWKNKYDFNSEVTADITVYAKWEEDAPPVVDPPVVISGTASLTKVDAEDPATVLPGVVFELHRSDGALIGAYTTNASGQITVYGLMPGTYYWRETRPAEGYILDGTEHVVTVYAGQTSSLVVKNERSGVPGVFSGDHDAYIIGSDGLVRPEANITRAEVATIFFRLLNEETRAAYMTDENTFADVNEGDWFNTAASTMAAMGIMTGLPDGGFHPMQNITRAEFATIAARFDANGNTTGASFTDIYGHWAEDEINIAANNGWILGFDGKFRPDDLITRAEAMTLVNRVLRRIPGSVGDLLPDMVTWADNMDTSRWYYLAVQEATNSHDYGRYADGYEYWTGLRPAPDWAALEK